MSAKKQKARHGGTENAEAVGPSDADFGLPSIDEGGDTAETQVDSTAKDAKAAGGEVSSMRIELSLPIGRGGVDGYTPRRVDARMTRSQSQTLLRLAAGLDAVDARLSTGRHVAANHRGHAVLWLLDRIEEALRDAATG